MASSRRQAEQLKKHGNGDDAEERTTTERWVPASDYWRRHNLQGQRQQHQQNKHQQHPNEGWYLSRLDGILEDLAEGTTAAAAAAAPADVLKLFREMYSVGRFVHSFVCIHPSSRRLDRGIYIYTHVVHSLARPITFVHFEARPITFVHFKARPITFVHFGGCPITLVYSLNVRERRRSTEVYTRFYTVCTRF